MFLYPSSLKAAESKPGNDSDDNTIPPSPFAKVFILTFMFLNTGCYTNKFQTAPPAGWDMVTPCSDWAPYPVYHLESLCWFSCPATSPGEHGAKHPFCTQVKGQSSCPLTPKGKLQPGRFMLYLYVLLS